MIDGSGFLGWYFSFSFAQIIAWFMAAIIYLHLQTATINYEQHLPAIVMLRCMMCARHEANTFLGSSALEFLLEEKLRQSVVRNQGMLITLVSGITVNQCSWFCVKMEIDPIAMRKMNFTRIIQICPCAWKGEITSFRRCKLCRFSDLIKKTDLLAWAASGPNW